MKKTEAIFLGDFNINYNEPSDKSKFKSAINHFWFSANGDHYSPKSWKDNKLLSESQYGFRKRRSTKLAAALLYGDFQKEMNNGNMVGAVHLDLSKVLDTIGHGLLLTKLQLYGVDGKELSWFTDDLLNNTQIVQIDSFRSSPEPIVFLTI